MSRELSFLDYANVRGVQLPLSLDVCNNDPYHCLNVALNAMELNKIVGMKATSTRALAIKSIITAPNAIEIIPLFNSYAFEHYGISTAFLTLARANNLVALLRVRDVCLISVLNTYHNNITIPTFLSYPGFFAVSQQRQENHNEECRLLSRELVDAINNP